MKRILLFAVLAVLALPASAFAGATKQYDVTVPYCGSVTFLQTGSGLIHEWRSGQAPNCQFDTTSGSTYYDVHQVWYPASKFAHPSCEFGALIWGGPYSQDSTPGTPEITGFHAPAGYGPISSTADYTVCVYPLNQKSSQLYNSDPDVFTCPTGYAGDMTTPVGDVLQSVSANGKVDTWFRVSGQAEGVYDIWANQDPGGCPLGSASNPGALTIGSDGTGAGHVTNALVSGATVGWISVTGTGTLLRSPAIGF